MLARATTLIDQIFRSQSSERADAETNEPSTAVRGAQTLDEQLSALRARALRIRAAERELRAEGKEVKREIRVLERRRQLMAKARRRQERHASHEQADLALQQERQRQAMLEHDEDDDGRPDLYIVKSPPPAPGSGVEQRKHRRIAMDVGVSMRSAHNFYTGVIRNISEDGLFISTFEVLAIGTVIDLSVRLPGQPAIQVKGEVRWSRPYDERSEDLESGIGVQLLDLAERERDVIARFIELRQPLLHSE